MRRIFNLPGTACLFALTTAVVLAIGAARFQSSVGAAAQQDHDTVSDYLAQMNAYEKQGRYDDAVQTGLRALRNTPRDAAVYQQIAMVCLIRAGKGSDRERWTAEAAVYIRKAVATEGDNPVNLLDAARGFEMAGDLSIARRCPYYLQAIELSETLTHVLERDHITIAGQRYSVDPIRKEFVAYGRTFRIKPLKDENEKLLLRMQGKSVDARCKWE